MDAFTRPLYVTKRISHSVANSNDGASTIQAESFFSRVRRAEIGIHHKIAGPYLAAYAAEMDWREDNRRMNNGEQYRLVVRRLATPELRLASRSQITGPSRSRIATLIERSSVWVDYT